LIVFYLEDWRDRVHRALVGNVRPGPALVNRGLVLHEQFCV